MPLIGVFISPVLSRFSQGLALSYFFFRSFEAVVLVAVALTNKFAILSLSEAYVSGGEAPSIQAALTLARTQNVWVDTAGTLYVVIFVCGALCLNAILFRSKMIPRWISLWVLISASVLGVLAVAAIFVTILPVLGLVLLSLIVVQEMVMALYFILRGFDTGALDASQTQAAAL